MLEGFDFGVGILLPVVGKTELDRRVMINTIGPVWDGNEVWLLVAGGATFAAFPNWYATLFSGFYLPLFLILAALIFRGVAFEFRAKRVMPQWKLAWDHAIFWGSLLPAILWGVAFANILRGTPIGPNGQLPRLVLQPAEHLQPVGRGHHPPAVRPARQRLPHAQDDRGDQGAGPGRSPRSWPRRPPSPCSAS